jgi:hypothetical protein
MTGDPITVNYVPVGDDWNVTVTRSGKSRKATAPGLIAARDQADQLVEKVAAGESDRTVVHLLEGDALAFSTVYLHTRHGLPLPEQSRTEPKPTPEAAAAPAPEPEPEANAKATAAEPTPKADAKPDAKSAPKADAKDAAAGVTFVVVPDEVVAQGSVPRQSKAGAQATAV